MNVHKYHSVAYPYITVGLCARNSGKTLSKAIRSILRTDYPEDKMELIVVDGMSRDKTMEIVKAELGDTSLRYVSLCDGGRGLCCARQMVFDSARGKYIVWMDGDNVVPSHFIRRHVEFMEGKPNVGASAAFIIPRGDTIVARLQGYQWLVPALVETRTRKLERHSKAPILGMQGVVCRVKAMKDVGGFDLGIMSAGEDVDVFIRMQHNGWKIGRTPNTWIYHYMRDDWRSLMRESVWWGYGRHCLSHKHRKMVGSLVTKRTRFLLLDMVELTLKSARLFKDSACLLMPLHYLWRRAGFFIGFSKAHRDCYGHQYDRG